MRVQHAQQRIGDLGELVIQPLVGTGGEERHPFHQPGHVRVLDTVRTYPQPACDVRVGFGEFRAEAAERIQFVVVIGQQAIGHDLRSVDLMKRHIRSGRIDGGVERDRLENRLNPQHRVDPQLQRAAQQAGVADQPNLNLLQPRFEAAHGVFDFRSHHFTLTAVVERSGGEVGHTVAQRGKPQFGQRRRR